MVIVMRIEMQMKIDPMMMINHKRIELYCLSFEDRDSVILDVI